MSSLNFEAKLSAVTALNFRNHGGNLVEAVKKKSDYLDHMTFGQIGSSVPCKMAVAQDHVLFVIDKKQVNVDAFDAYYEWKKTDILDGMENAAVLSQETGLELKSELGIITLFDNETNKAYLEDVRSKKIEGFIQAGRDKGYDWRYVEGEDKNYGIALYKKTNNEAKLTK